MAEMGKIMANLIEKLPKHDLVFRTFHAGGMTQLLSVGFMAKNERREDTVNLEFPFYSLVLVLRGSGVFIDEATDRRWPLSDGSVFQRIPGRKHTLLVDLDGRWREASFSLGWLAPEEAAAVRGDRWPWPAPESSGNRALVELLARLAGVDPAEPVRHPGVGPGVVEEFLRLHGALKQARMAELPGLQLPLWNLAARLVRPAPLPMAHAAEARFIERALEILHANYANRRTLPELLKELGVSYSHLRRQFRARQGITLEEYRIQLRIDAACRFLRSGDEPLGAIAERLGYADEFSFGRQFRARLGIAPGRFRRGGQ